MTERITPSIDQEKCTGCGLCIEVCPDQTISMEGNKAAVTGSRCLQCGHCAAICPISAIEVKGIAPDSFSFKSFELNKRWLRWGDFDTSELVRLMASRRSCRNYLERPVSRDILEDLVKIGTTAPSGTNSQKWTFTVLDRREQVEKFGDRIGAFFRKLNKMAANPLLRLLSRLFSNDALGNYYRRYYDSIKKGLEKRDKEGCDLLFHGAPAVILVGSEVGGSCPAEDALLATQNILLGAHAMGLGSCLIGFAVSAIQRDPTIKDILTIPRQDEIYAVIALGHPNEHYQRLTGRRLLQPRFPDMT
jgi:nitroreductase/NAD-dependent dihydropyrimidine dehydrogenase PreA subunit